MSAAKNKDKVEATEPETGTTPIDELVGAETPEFAEDVKAPDTDHTPKTGINTSKGAVELDAADRAEALADRDPLGSVAPSEAKVTNEDGTPFKGVLVITYLNGATREVPLAPGSVVEYVGGSYVRWTNADGSISQGQLDVDFAGVELKQD